MTHGDETVSTELVVLLLVPVLVAVSLVGFVIFENLAASQPSPSGPDAVVVIDDHPDVINRSGQGEGIIRGTNRGGESLPWSTLVIEAIDPRSDAVVVSLSAPSWSDTGAGQTIELHTNGTVPAGGETLGPDGTFVVRDVLDDTDDTPDLIDECQSYVFRARHTRSETVLGTYEVTFVSPDWIPGSPCVAGDG